MNKITVVIPCLKENSGLKRVLYSVLNQNFKDIDILIVANHKVEKILRGRDVRYIEVFNVENTAQLLNEAVNNINTKLVCFLHPDELLLFDAVKLRYEKFLENPSLIACYGMGFDTDMSYQLKQSPNYEHYFSRGSFPHITLTGILSGEILPSITSLMIKTDVLKTLNFDTSLELNYCTDFFIRLLQSYSDNVCQIESPLYISRNEEALVQCYKKSYFMKYLKEKVRILDKFFDTEILADIELKTAIYKKNYFNFLMFLIDYFPFNYWLRISLLASYIKKNNELGGKLFDFWYLSVLINSITATQRNLRTLNPVKNV